MVCGDGGSWSGLGFGPPRKPWSAVCDHGERIVRWIPPDHLRTGLVYEIARYSVHADTDMLIERAQVVSRDGALWRRLDDGPESRCPETDVAAVIATDPMLSEVRANQVTRIMAEPVALRDLPMALQVPGDGADFDDSLWSESMFERHVSAGSWERDMCRALYINEARWGACTTSEGDRMLPEGGDWERLPLLTPCWGKLRFCEEGAAMTVGGDLTLIGRVTPGVVCWATLPDVDDDEILLKRRDDDAAMFVEWLLQGSIADQYSSAVAFMDVLLARLFVEASINDLNDKAVSGSYLLAGTEIAEPDDTMFCHDSSHWTLQLDLQPAMVDAVLDLLGQRSPQLSDIITAGRDPASPPGIARRAALEQWEQQDHDGWATPRA
jgi:hypothetical protein